MNLGSESEFVEFKKSTGEHKEALQAISAMLNKHGRGELYFGVKDDGEVIGQEISDATLRQVASWMSDKIEPTVFPTVERLETEKGLQYVRVEFSGLSAPYSADDRYFTRVGTSNKALSASELGAIVIRRERSRNPWDSLPSGRPVSDADEQAVREFVELGLHVGRVSGEFTDVPDALSRLGMVAPDGTLTNAAAVAFCEAPGAYPRMKLGLLAGNDKLDILDLRQEFLPLIPLLRRAELFVVSNIRRRFIFGEPGMQRREVPEIPREAVRETIANALCHRDYETGTSVQVNVYMDFIEVVSPGPFPEGDSPDRHFEGSGSDFRQRNPNIAQVLFRSGMIEQYGTGIPRIKRACDAADVTFSYRQDANSTVIRFERPGAQVTVAEDSAGAGSKTPAAAANTAWDALLDNLGKSERKAMELAVANGTVSTGALVESAQITRRAASAVLKRLSERGLLEWVGKNAHDPGQFYRFPNDGRFTS